MILKATQLTKHFSSPALLEILKGIDLEVNARQSVAITGKSGEGKSTLLHILGTLEKPSSGMLEICGKNALSSSAFQLRSREIGFIFQNCHLIDDDTTLENVLMPAKIAREPTKKGSAAYEWAWTLLEATCLLDRAHYRCRQLSGGEKQRVGLARALCNNPSLILADEPSGNLDQYHSEQIHRLLIRLCKDFDKALVIVTHDPELSRLCDKILLLKGGILYPESRL